MYDKRIEASQLTEEESVNTSGMGNFYPPPEGVAGWSWGAFLLNWIWGIFNRVWIGLVVPVPWIVMTVAESKQVDVLQWPAYVKLGIFVLALYAWIVVPISLGKSGRVRAWQNKHWESLEHFNKVQRRWSICGIFLTAVPICLLIGVGLTISGKAKTEMSEHTLPAYQFSQRAAAAVGSYLEKNRMLPADLHQAGFDEVYPGDIQSISVNQENGQLRVVLTTPAIRSQAFYLAPRFEDDGRVAWRCLAGEIRKQLLPPECKFDATEDFYIPPLDQR